MQRSSFWDGVRSNVLGGIIIAALLALFALMIQKGWMITVLGGITKDEFQEQLGSMVEMQKYIVSIKQGGIFGGIYAQGDGRKNDLNFDMANPLTGAMSCPTPEYKEIRLRFLPAEMSNPKVNPREEIFGVTYVVCYLKIM